MGSGGFSPQPPCRRDGCPRGCVVPRAGGMGCLMAVPSPASAVGCRMGCLGRCVHTSLGAVPQAGATTPRNTILLQGLLHEVTRGELEGGCPSPRASGKEYWGIKLLLKWCLAISKGCNASRAVRGRTWCTGFGGFEAWQRVCCKDFSALRFLASCFLVQCFSSFLLCNGAGSAGWQKRPFNHHPVMCKT